jgi:hypothetical protein
VILGATSDTPVTDVAADNRSSHASHTHAAHQPSLQIDGWDGYRHPGVRSNAPTG